MDVLEARLAADRVLHDGLALVGHAQAYRALFLIPHPPLAPEPALGAVTLLVSLHILRGGARAIGVPRLKQRSERLSVALGAL